MMDFFLREEWKRGEGRINNKYYLLKSLIKDLIRFRSFPKWQKKHALLILIPSQKWKPERKQCWPPRLEVKWKYPDGILVLDEVSATQHCPYIWQQWVPFLESVMGTCLAAIFTDWGIEPPNWSQSSTLLNTRDARTKLKIRLQIAP